MRELWAVDTTVVSSWITYSETAAAIASARRSRRISQRAMTEEVVVVTEAGPYEIDMELIPAEDAQNENQAQSQQPQQQDASSFEMPGRGAGPR